MMNEEMIRRSDAIDVISLWFEQIELNPDILIDGIKALPTIESKRGEWIEWIDCEGEVFWKCSACGQVSEASAADILYKFCPFCGADMREREGE